MMMAGMVPRGGLRGGCGERDDGGRRQGERQGFHRCLLLDAGCCGVSVLSTNSVAQGNVPPASGLGRPSAVSARTLIRRAASPPPPPPPNGGGGAGPPPAPQRPRAPGQAARPAPSPTTPWRPTPPPRLSFALRWIASATSTVALPQRASCTGLRPDLIASRRSSSTVPRPDQRLPSGSAISRLPSSP